MMQCGSHRSIVRPAVAGGCPARNQPRGVWSDLSRGAVVFRVRWAVPGKVARPGRQRNRKRTSHDRRRVTSCPVSKPISGAPSCRPVRCRIRWNASFGCGSMRFSCRQPPATPAGTGPVFRFRGALALGRLARPVRGEPRGRHGRVRVRGQPAEVAPAAGRDGVGQAPIHFGFSGLRAIIPSSLPHGQTDGPAGRFGVYPMRPARCCRWLSSHGNPQG